MITVVFLLFCLYLLHNKKKHIKFTPISDKIACVCWNNPQNAHTCSQPFHVHSLCGFQIRQETGQIVLWIFHKCNTFAKYKKETHL